MNRLSTTALLAGLAGLACAACAAPGSRLSQPIEARSRTPEPVPEPTLYARNGTPVKADYADEAHALRTDGGSRMYLLELYQEAVDRREALELEVGAMNDELAHVQRQLAARDEELAAAGRREKAMHEERDRLVAENDDLTARLVTAQIRRLEAEKLLLEAKIEWLRAEDAREDTQASQPANEGVRR
jgi:hypothetical protein